MVRASERKKPSLPVLLFHPWENGFKKSFEICLNWLKRERYHTIDPTTLIKFLEGRRTSLPSKSILLTFDDGTQETYQTVYPLLRKYGLKGMAFVMTAPRLMGDSKKPWWREVERSGGLRIESHSHSHGLVFRSRQVIDFYKGETGDDSFLVKGMDRRIGAPIYRYGYELIYKRYYPEGDISRRCVGYVKRSGGQDFFKKQRWKKILLNIVDQCRKQEKRMGFYETKQGWRTRVGIEINRSKRIIERTIGKGKKVIFFAYPWGVYNEVLIHHLKRAGYQGAFTNEPGSNYLGTDPFKIRRITITSEMKGKDLANILKSSPD